MKPFSPLLSPALLIALIGTPLHAEQWVRLSPDLSKVTSIPVSRMSEHATIEGETGHLQLGTGTEDKNRSVLALLAAAPCVGYPLSQGTTKIVIDLADQYPLKFATFYNEGVSGKMTIRAAATRRDLDEGNLTGTGVAVFNKSDVTVKVNLSGIEAKYTELVFETAEAGRIYSFGIFTPQKGDDYILKVGTGVAANAGQSVSPDELVSINLANPITGTSIAYLSSGKVREASALMDSDPTTNFEFAANDPAPTVVLDLGRSINMGRYSWRFAAEKGTTAHVYVLNKLPEQENWKGDLSLDSTFLDGVEPTESVVDNTGMGRIAANHAKVGRYVVVRLTPPNSATAFLKPLWSWVAAPGAGMGMGQIGIFSPSITIQNTQIVYTGQGENNLAGNFNPNQTFPGGIFGSPLFQRNGLRMQPNNGFEILGPLGFISTLDNSSFSPVLVRPAENP